MYLRDKIIYLIDRVARHFEARLSSNNNGDVGIGVEAVKIVILVR